MLLSTGALIIMRYWLKWLIGALIQNNTIYLQYPTDLPVNHQSTDNNAQYKQTSTIITNIYINDCNTIIITEGSQSHSWTHFTDGLPWKVIKTRGANTRSSPQQRVPKDNILCRKVDLIVPPKNFCDALDKPSTTSNLRKSIYGSVGHSCSTDLGEVLSELRAIPLV